MEFDTKTRKMFNYSIDLQLTVYSALHDLGSNLICLHIRSRPVARHSGLSQSLTITPTHAKIIKTGAIDDVYRAVVTCDEEEKCTEGKSIVANLAKLKYELQHDRPLT